MTRRETVHSELTQEEKRQVQRDTLFGRAVAEEGMVGGRWATESKQRVVGSRPPIEQEAETAWIEMQLEQAKGPRVELEYNPFDREHMGK